MRGRNKHKKLKQNVIRLNAIDFEKQLKKALEEGTEKSRLKNDRVKNSRG